MNTRADEQRTANAIDTARRTSVGKKQHALMIVSADAGPGLRSEVAAGLRPCPEFLRLEQVHGVQLLDWSMLRHGRRGRSVTRSLQHVAAVLPRLREFDVVFSDGEHVGIPLALAMNARRVATPHLVVGHHLLTNAKSRLFRWTHARRRINRILVHSAQQVEPVIRELRVRNSQVSFVPYGVDTEFWSPQSVVEEPLVISAGREHRDYENLALACAGEPFRVVITDSSAHSPRARRSTADALPANMARQALSFVELRKLYATASVVVVPLVPTEFPAGITAVLEAMSMGKAVVVSDTRGLEGVVHDNTTGVVVPPGDVARLRQAIHSLVTNPAERHRLGRAAREIVVARYGLDGYVDQLGRHLGELGRCATKRRDG